MPGLASILQMEALKSQVANPDLPSVELGFRHRFASFQTHTLSFIPIALVNFKGIDSTMPKSLHVGCLFG